VVDQRFAGGVMPDRPQDQKEAEEDQSGPRPTACLTGLVHGSCRGLTEKLHSPPHARALGPVFDQLDEERDENTEDEEFRDLFH
jgi:hypothetical protein